MKNFTTDIKQEIINLICDSCGLKASVDKEGNKDRNFYSVRIIIDS